MQHNHVAMERSEFETVLANWLAQAASGDGQLADGVEPAQWVATNAVNWRRSKIDDSLFDAEGAANRVRDPQQFVEKLLRRRERGQIDQKRITGISHETSRFGDAELVDLGRS